MPSRYYEQLYTLAHANPCPNTGRRFTRNVLNRKESPPSRPSLPQTLDDELALAEAQSDAAFEEIDKLLPHS